MFFHENEVSQMMKLRQEEVEKKARHAWKYEGVKKESIFSKWIKAWKSRQKPTMVQQNCCACQC